MFFEFVFSNLEFPLEQFARMVDRLLEECRYIGEDRGFIFDDAAVG